jgi:hypothetical protein
MKYLPVLVISLLAIIGCTTPNNGHQPSKIQMRQSMFIGKTITRFILDNGTPYNRINLGNGSRVYSWNSGNTIYTPSFIQDMNEDRDEFITTECELRIYTTQKGKITSIIALQNRSKNWDASACIDPLK